MFDDISDDELEVQTEASDELLDDMQDEEDLKKPGPFQVMMTAMFYVTSGQNNLMKATSNQIRRGNLDPHLKYNVPKVPKSLHPSMTSIHSAMFTYQSQMTY